MGIRAEMEGSVYLCTKMTHILVSVNRMEVGSVEANTVRMFLVGNISVYFPQENEEAYATALCFFSGKLFTFVKRDGVKTI